VECSGIASCTGAELKVVSKDAEIYCTGGMGASEQAAVAGAIAFATSVGIDTSTYDVGSDPTLLALFESGSCAYAESKYNVLIYDGTVKCAVGASCYNASLKTDAECLDDYACYGAEMHKDFICMSEMACNNTIVPKGAGGVCCGVGCANAGYGYWDGEAGEGCDRDADDIEHDDYGTLECVQCGKKSVFSLITGSAAGTIVAVVICLLLLGIVIGVLVFLKRKVTGSTQEVE